SYQGRSFYLLGTIHFLQKDKVDSVVSQIFPFLDECSELVTEIKKLPFTISNPDFELLGGLLAGYAEKNLMINRAGAETPSLCSASGALIVKIESALKDLLSLTATEPEFIREELTLLLEDKLRRLSDLSTLNEAFCSDYTSSFLEDQIQSYPIEFQNILKTATIASANLKSKLQDLIDLSKQHLKLFRKREAKQFKAIMDRLDSDASLVAAPVFYAFGASHVCGSTGTKLLNKLRAIDGMELAKL
ncbi:MAG: hypothetical protein GWP59_03050, partial [Chlamydiales bacterium]|nr:hypothetical protein [Chlamydiales bacterium]